MQSYEKALFNVQVIRKHFFKDRAYQLYLFADEMVMTDDPTKSPKYNLKTNLTTTIRWICENKRIVAFEFSYNGRLKEVYGPKLNLLKEMLAGKVFFNPVTTFYQFHMEIGSGMTGSVYRCISTENNENYFAIKKVDKMKIAQNDGAIPQLIHELSLLNQLQHPSIVKLKETYVDQQNYYIVMEYINGKTLYTELQSRQYGLSVNETIKIMKELLEAIIYIHNKGIMHRDINPLNIMKAEQVKLIDFGLARKIRNQLIFPTSGTPGYMAPEIINFNKDKPYDEKADIFSLGCVLYKLLTGENLFNTKQSKQTIYQSNKEGIFELKKQSQHPEYNSNKMDQLFILLPYMLESNPQLRLNAKVCLTILEEIENNNLQIERLIKKILIRKQLAFNTSEEHQQDKKSEEKLQKCKFRQSIDMQSKKSLDEISVFSKNVMLQNQKRVILPQKKQP
ncbi:unnamed protein product [Paramecium pentaurelia]|uniref:Protein kinase domain-containing protein n=1 Tax=Paramecium pentaurelia TaxID=43138 RepID=A0A8S1WFN2_9CILI|nr:unnamed protein product [Paramecium pentaurelia]